MSYIELDQKISEWVDLHRDEMLQSLRDLIAIPSVMGDTADGAPFGAETRRALDFVVDLAAQRGFVTKMLDGYAAHAELGSGESLIGVLSHVDVVPAGSDWVHPPFAAEIEEGKIFGRGAVDDKGPTIAGLYALFALAELDVPLRKRIRAIWGADEESGFRCMAHYFQNEEMPEFGFTPDGAFPAIYAEKGIATASITAPLPLTPAPFKLLSLTAGNRSNMVPDRAEAVLSFDATPIVPIQQSLELFDQIETDVEIDQLIVRARGVSAHGSTPQDGVSAVKRLADALLSLVGLGGEDRALLTTLQSYASVTDGSELGLAGSDDVSGPLTNNLGVLSTQGSSVFASFSIRYPVTWLGADVKARMEESVLSEGFTVSDFKDAKPLYVPLDDPNLAICLDAYRAETGDYSPPKTTGGGTYARVLKSGVAFGADFPGFPMMAHQADEYWFVEDLIKATKIYAKVLARLAC